MRTLIMVVGAVGTMACQAAVLRVDPSVVREVDRHRFLGTNAGLWHEARQLFDTDVQYYLRELNPSFIRIPGGSWSDEYIWNGNGVWDGNTFDMSKLVDGQWEIDYSDYKPGFHLLAPGKPDEWHGNVDVYALHEFAKDKGSHSIVTVNVGSGTPEMAAEWVRWANLEMGYGVEYWEIGNELEGRWEMGSTLPDGSRMTGEVYAQRFIEYAKAMKAVDPSIKIGGPTAASTRAPFMEALLRDAGEHVDFISFHTYPVERHLAGEREMVEQAFSLQEPMTRYRGLVEKYQPHRVGEIEFAITEWNSKVLEDRHTGELLNGLWSAIFVGEMFREGVTFATQWDLLTTTEEGGHGLFHFAGRCMPKSQYWGLYLWSKYMGNQLVASELKGNGDAYAVVTRDDGRLYAMVVNVSRDAFAEIELDVPGVEFASEGRMATLSHREYFWDIYKHEPKWSRKPNEERFAIDGKLEVPPYSARVFELPFKGGSVRPSGDTENAEIQPLEILLPESAPADQPVEGWVFLQNDPADAKVGRTFDAAKVSVEGPAGLDVATVWLGEAAGRFFLTPTGAGTATVRARAGEVSVEREIEILPVQERRQIIWQFEDAPANWNAETSYKLIGDDAVRPNQQVAAVVLDGDKPTSGNDRLAVFSPPGSIDRKRIAGVVLDVGASSNFQCADKQVGIRVVLQSEMDHWIELGSLTLEEVRGKWKTLELRLPDPKYYAAMGKTYALFIQLYQNDGKKVPVSGKVYLDNVGFVLR
ncbi:Intracellular exo-alpha-(1-_5)-L-arabinofuranosidase 1 [Pontiella desulfatans]|uniref:Intracellular exo-alpha-(1->5)-L-arabinofuranosidase 1 n=1 Tax=Pontiella desulfatans TaxID=2750659 RepID=A0A6C2U3P5_PONDE|nr:glycoside hydrolase family 44 protein [Pontiella desulfatans]VGO14513.1 Intracellular exo-alpha-(1->5)-L-arabinofuranosidase 1 [Pontiella desulfatans]